MNLTRLVHVTEVGRRSSFSKAAAALGVSQSAVTKSVASVESQLGYPIFHRTSRGALVTDLGRDFVARATRILADANELFSDVASDRARIEGRLRVGVCPASFDWMLVSPVSRLLQRYAGLVLDVTAASAERITELLRRGDVDVAIGPHASFAEWPELRTEPVGVANGWMFVRRDHPLTGAKRIAPESVTEHPFITTSFVRDVSPMIDALYEARGKDPKRWIHTIEYFPLVRRIVMATDAVSVVADPFAHSAAFRRHFVALDQFDFFPDIAISCATRRRWPPKPAASALIVEFLDGPLADRRSELR